MELYPCVPKKYSWMEETCSQFETSRCLIIAYLTNNARHFSEHFNNFEECSITDVKTYLNSVEYPCESFNVNFVKNLFTVFYQRCADFQKYYYERKYTKPYFSKAKFKQWRPIFSVHNSRQNENAKTSTVDRRIEFETAKDFPVNTSAYCLRDRIIQYNPF